MSKKIQKSESPEMGSSDEGNSSRRDAADGDDDFDFNENNGSQEQAKSKKNNNDNAKNQVIQNQPFDEAFEVSDGGSEIASDNGQHLEEDEKPANDSTDEPPTKPQTKQQQQQQQAQTQGNNQKTQQKPNGQKPQAMEKKDDSEEEDPEKERKIPGAYNPADYAHLNVTPEIEDLFRHITRYKPITVDLDTKLKPFIPDYIPAVGEVDAFLKPSRPDGQPETLGLLTIDEPCLNQSKKSKLDLEIKEFLKKKKGDSSSVIHSIENADKNPKEILAWINDVSEIHKKKQPPSVVYTKPFPEIEQLMQEWPLEIEDALQNLKLPTEELDMDLAQYCKLACALLDIPVHNTTNQKNLIESLHVFFTLYSEFRANPHFQQKDEQYDGFAQAS